MPAEDSVYLSGENLEELHELLEGEFLDDDEDLKCHYCGRKCERKESLSV